MFCLVIFMGNYCLPFHFSYIIMHLKILFLFYYLVVPPIVHSYYISFIESLILGYGNLEMIQDII